MNPQDIQNQYYDKTSKRCLVALASWFYLYLNTGVEAVVGRELSQELIDLFGKKHRVCDALFELLGVVLRGRPVAGLFHLDAQTRAKGDEVRRAVGYKGLIIDGDRFADVMYFVQAFIFLTALPDDFIDRIAGFPDDMRLVAIDMTKVDGLELLEEGIPEAAVFAVLSVVAPRNLLIQGIVEILNALTTLEERALWIEACFAFGKLRKDHKTFNMELKQELERTATGYSRQEELRFIFGDLIEAGYEQGQSDGYQQGQLDGYQQGQSDGYQQGQSDGYRKGEFDGRNIGKMEERVAIAKNLLRQGVSLSVIAAATGLTAEEISCL